VGGVAVVAEPVVHEAVPQVRHLRRHQPSGRRRPRPAETGERRDDHVEGVGRVAVVGRRIAERAEEMEILQAGAGPAMGEHQRARVRAAPGDPHRVHCAAADV